MSLVAACEAEVRALHDFFEGWFTAKCPRTADEIARLKDALGPEGEITSWSAIISSVEQRHGAADDHRRCSSKPKLPRAASSGGTSTNRGFPSDARPFHSSDQHRLMSSQACDGCGDRVRVAGGIANLWTLDPGPSGGFTLELGDGTDHFLCFSCLEMLPDDATGDDVAALED